MSDLHTFHIPVLGIAYTIDTPIKVAHFGISSVISIVDDELLEQMRQFYCQKMKVPYFPIGKNADDSRALRITAYLNLVNDIVNEQIANIRSLPFEGDNDLKKYFELLPDDSLLKLKYLQMIALSEGAHKSELKHDLLGSIRAGNIDVNIMVKVDKINRGKNGEELPSEYSDALSALRGYARSNLRSSVVLSAGYNPRLYTYIESFADFFPDENGEQKKKIIVKVSDYRSALVQGKILAKKGIWVSEFRIESGLNCGGHAFATEGLLLGPILEDFKNNRDALTNELYQLCSNAHRDKNIPSFNECPNLRVTVQGGIGTADEQRFLLNCYGVDSTGWGSPFLLVPEATNVDSVTLQNLAKAKKEDYYLSNSSPLGVPFNNFRNSSAEQQRIERAQKGRPGSPCYKKFLVSNTEFTHEPICTASRQYQHLKIKQLKEQNLPEELYNAEYNKVIEKDCLCEGLTAPVVLKENIPNPHKLNAVTICPGPNLAYFSGVSSLSNMIDHIYGRKNILNSLPRPHMFINELHLYIDFLKNAAAEANLDMKRSRYLATFKRNLQLGIEYYRKLGMLRIEDDLKHAEEKLHYVNVPLV